MSAYKKSVLILKNPTLTGIYKENYNTSWACCKCDLKII